MTKTGQIILAIESAICGGSISLIKDGREIANWIGTSNVAKAEDLLVNIDGIFTLNNVSCHDVDLIAVSAGPGSFTGIRIGVATALGLKAGLGIEISSESALKAMASSIPATATVVAAVPVGRNSICVQKFQIIDREVIARNNPRAHPYDKFFKYLREERDSSIILHEFLYERCKPTASIINFGSNIAYAIGRIGIQQPGVITKPLFISKSL